MSKEAQEGILPLGLLPITINKTFVFVLIWLPSGVDDGDQLTQKQVALRSMVMS